MKLQTLRMYVICKYLLSCRKASKLRILANYFSIIRHFFPAKSNKSQKNLRGLFSYKRINLYYVKWVPRHYGIARPQISERREGLQIWRVATNGSSGQPKRGHLTGWGWVGRWPNASPQSQHFTKCYTGPQTWRALVNTIMNLQVP
jgi:hypothetical protein